MIRSVGLLVAALALAGCAESLLPLSAKGETGGWSSTVEPTMAPDFTGDGETYPILLVHQHHVASKRQQEEWSQVVCSTTGGEALPLLGAKEATDAAACARPSADAATGRLYFDAAEFRSEAPTAVVAITNACSGGLVLLRESLSGFVFHAPGHSFLVESHANRSFSVDGRWITPGTALKVGYFIDRGSERDEQSVRVVFDHPGEWLASKVAPWDPALDGDVPPRPSEGTGLSVDVPLAPASLLEALDATLAATPGHAEGLAALRMVHDGSRLTEATIRYATSGGSVTWYGAGRTGDSLRMLGAETPSMGARSVPIEAFRETFDAGWATLRAGNGGSMTDVRLDPAISWSGPGGAALALDPALHPAGCRDGCVLVRADDALLGSGWQMLLAPEPSEAVAALTLHVLAFPDGGGEAAALWWHAPAT